MTDSEATTVTKESFLECLKTLPWCRQGDNVLVAVAKASPDIIEHMKGHEVKVFPGGIAVKMQKSVITNFQRAHDDGMPLPVVLVWRPEGVEIWYRKVKQSEYPYDAWMDSAAAAYEQERVLIPAAELGVDFSSSHAEIVGRANACPSSMPQY
jgi:hypothetical protein